MIIAGYEYRDEKPFSNVYLTGIVRDKQRRKMSKSLGNSPDPIELMKKYGADGVRMGMLLTSAAGNDLLFEESLCKQGRNFNNKIWNSFRLIKGWEVDDTIAQPETSEIAIKWLDYVISKTIEEMDDLFLKYRLSEALMLVYKLFWDEFSSWYLELVKPAYQQPIDRATYESTLSFFDSLLRILHPFMPFITEELWQAIAPREEGESIMITEMPLSKEYDNNFLSNFEHAKHIISGIRSIRLQKNIPNKDALSLEILGAHDTTFDSAIQKMGNLDSIDSVTEKSKGAAPFMVGTTEFAIPLSENIDIEAELEKMRADLKYQEGFLKSVEKKLSNERFVQNAKAEIVDNERKKQADAVSKIASLKENIKALESK